MSEVMEEDLVSLLNLAGGAAIERWDDEFRRALENAMDINTGLGKRTVTLTVTLQPKDERRNICNIKFHCTSKILPAVQVETQVHIGRDPNRGPVAVEYNPEQLKLFPRQNADPSKIINFQQSQQGGQQ